MKHSKIVNNEAVKSVVDRLLSEGCSYKEISETLEHELDISLSHTAIMNYNKDFNVRDNNDNSNVVVDKAIAHDMIELKKHVQETIAEQTFVVVEKYKNGQVRAKDFAMLEKASKSVSEAIRLIEALSVDGNDMIRPFKRFEVVLQVPQ